MHGFVLGLRQALLNVAKHNVFKQTMSTTTQTTLSWDVYTSRPVTHVTTAATWPGSDRRNLRQDTLPFSSTKQTPIFSRMSFYVDSSDDDD